MDTQQKVKQYKNVAVALVKDEEGNVLLTKPLNSSKPSKAELALEENWEFPTNEIIPGATYTETFVSEILEKTGCIIEALSLIASEKHHSQALHFEYVECKVVCRDSSVKIKRVSPNHRWVHPSKVKTFHKKKINRDILVYLGL
jgi:hypothetical protein